MFKEVDISRPVTLEQPSFLWQQWIEKHNFQIESQYVYRPLIVNSTTIWIKIFTKDVKVSIILQFNSSLYTGVTGHDLKQVLR